MENLARIGRAWSNSSQLDPTRAKWVAKRYPTGAKLKTWLELGVPFGQGLRFHDLASIPVGYLDILALAFELFFNCDRAWLFLAPKQLAEIVQCHSTYVRIPPETAYHSDAILQRFSDVEAPVVHFPGIHGTFWMFSETNFFENLNPLNS